MGKRKRISELLKPRKVPKFGPEIDSCQSGNVIRQPVLAAHYTTLLSLREFLICRLPSSSRNRRKRIATFDGDYPDHTGFLDDTVVGISENPAKHVREERKKQLVAFTQTQRAASGQSIKTQRCSIDEILAFTIWNLFQKEITSSRVPDHILCYGFQKGVSVREADARQQELVMPGIVRHTSNANINSLTTKPWPLILALLGEDGDAILADLLIDCGLFIRVASGANNYYQLSGRPLFRQSSDEDHQSAHQATKPKMAPGIVPNTKVIGPAAITFVRNRMYYARPSINSHGQVHFGMKHIHVFNRYNRLDNEEHNMQVMRYVFPKQFGLHNVFTSVVDRRETVQPFKDYTIREDEIERLDRKRKKRFPLRLRGAAKNLVLQIRKNHKVCSYTQLLRYYCRTYPRAPVHGEEMRSSTLYHQTRDARRIEQLTYPDQNVSVNKTETIDNQNGSFLPYAIPASKVSAFCQAILRKLLPANALGLGRFGDHNWHILLAGVDRFITMRRFESTTLHEVTQSLKIKCIDWLRPAQVTEADNMSASDNGKRIELLQEFVYFIFDSLLIPLIRSNFYVTETGIQRNKLSYFRHDVWRRLSEPSLTTLRTSMFKPLNSRQLRHAFQSSRLGYSQVRLLPKQIGARPITNLRRRAMKVVNGKRFLSTSINAQLAPVFNILNYERDHQPERLGSALFSVQDLRQKLIEFRSTVRKDAAKLFFVKVDIQSCFDNIPQTELVKLADMLLSEYEYRTIKYVEVKQLATLRGITDGRSINKFLSYAQPAETLLPFSSTVAEKFANSKKRTVFIGTDQERLWQRQQVQKLLRDHLQHNIVRVGRKHFLQTRGIPQGSILSSLLCSFFYAKFEREHLGFLDPQSSLLLRLIDDFLLVTTDQEQAERFLKIMSKGNVAFGISISPGKSLVNFETTIGGSKIPHLIGTSRFPYCGIYIDVKTLELSKDRHRKDLHLENTLTVDIHGKAGSSFQRRVLSTLRIQLHPMLLDSSLNGRCQIINTLFESYVETAMKMHQYRKNMPCRKRPGSRLMIMVCQQLILLANKRMQAMKNSEYLINRSQICWIAATALTKILTKKQSEYKEVLTWLANLEQTTRRSMDGMRKGLDDVQQSGIMAFQGYVY